MLTQIHSVHVAVQTCLNTLVCVYANCIYILYYILLKRFFIANSIVIRQQLIHLYIYIYKIMAKIYPYLHALFLDFLIYFVIVFFGWFRSSTSTAAAAFAIATSASSNPRDDTYEHSTIKESDERVVSSPATIRVLNVLRYVHVHLDSFFNMMRCI